MSNPSFPPKQKANLSPFVHARNLNVWTEVTHLLRLNASGCIWVHLGSTSLDRGRRGRGGEIGEGWDRQEHTQTHIFLRKYESLALQVYSKNQLPDLPWLLPPTPEAGPVQLGVINRDKNWIHLWGGGKMLFSNLPWHAQATALLNPSPGSKHPSHRCVQDEHRRQWLLWRQGTKAQRGWQGRGVAVLHVGPPGPSVTAPGAWGAGAGENRWAISPSTAPCRWAATAHA